MYFHKVLRIYKIQFAILLFLCLFGLFHWIQPSISYQPNGAFRPFGVGFRNKTVIPAWIMAIVLAILSYVFVSSLVQMR